VEPVCASSGDSCIVMLRVAALTSGRHTPASRYRVRQHVPALLKHGIRVREYCPIIEKYASPPRVVRRLLACFGQDRTEWHVRLKKLDRLLGLAGSHLSEVTWLERILIPSHLSFEPILKKPLVFDVDDAIWLGEGAGITDAVARRADVVIAGNGYLADWFSRYHDRIEIIPTAVDTKFYRPGTAEPGEEFVVGWTGLSSNYRFVQLVATPLARFLATHRDAVLVLMSDSPPAGLELPRDRVRFVRWRPDDDFRVIQSFDVGIMPLSDDEWTRGKCSFKMLQYMATSVPVIVSPVGMNKEILSEAACGLGPVSSDDWYEALVYCHRHRAAIREWGRNGRELVRRKYSTEVISRQLARVFLELGGQPVRASGAA